MNSLLHFMKHSFAVGCMLMAFHTVLSAQQTTYIGPATGGDWFSAANWDMGLPAAGNNALIGGGNTVNIPSALNVNYEINNFGTLNVAGPVVIASGTGKIANSGTLNMNAGSSMVNNNIFQNFSGVVFAAGATFTNETGGTFSNNGTFTIPTTLLNKGTVSNNGTINATNGTIQEQGSFTNSQVLTTKMLTVAAGSTFTNQFGSNLTITGSGASFNVLGNVVNNGIINNNSAMTISGTFTNNVSLINDLNLTINAGGSLTNSGSGTITNNATMVNNGMIANSRDFINTGTFTNNLTFNNNGTIDNKATGTFTNNTAGTLFGNFGSLLINRGTFSNKNTMTTNGATTNEGTFTNDATFTNDVGAVWLNKENFINNGTIQSIATMTNDKTFTNAGTLNVNSGSIFTNNLTFTNAITGVVNNNFEIVNNAGATLTNNGRLINNIRMFLDGTSINNAYWASVGDITIRTGGILTNNEVFVQTAGNILNQGTLANTKLFRSDECSTIHNKNGTINNISGSFEYNGILFQRGTLSGLPLTNNGGYLHTNTTSAAPSLCLNKSISADVNGDVKVYATEVIAFSNFDSCQTIIYRANGLARPLFACSDIGTVKNVNIAVTTRLGDSLTCVSQVTPIDVLAPTFSNCPSDVVIYTPTTSATATWTPPTAIDNCSAVNMTSNFIPGASFNVGITGVSYVATDVYGNSQTCQFKVDVIKTPAGGSCTGDNTGPVFSNCPANITLSTFGFSTPAVWTTPTVTDPCLPISYTTTAVPGTVFQAGTTTVKYTAKDGNNNTSTCQFTVTVTQNNICATDVQKPVIFNCPANIFATTSATLNGAIALWKTPNASDNCNLASLTANMQSGSVFPVGTTTVTYTATDGVGNTNSCSFIVNVASTDPCPGDVAGPVISGCPSNIIRTISSGTSSTATWTAPSASDACGPVTLNATHVSGAVFPIGNTSVMYQASDKKGNKSTCAFVVTVVNVCEADTTKPTISGCPANITIPQSGTTTPVSWTPATASDNCSLISFHSSCLPGSSFPAGSTVVGYTATDLKGNISACTFIVNVVGQAACTTNGSPINESTNISAASATLTWNSIPNATGYDVFLGTINPPTTKVGTDVAGTSFNTTTLLNTTQYFWYVVPKTAGGAAQGCASSATSFTTGTGGTTTVLNITCPANVGISAAVGATTAVASYAAPTTNSTCPTGTITINRTTGLASGSAFPVGTTQVCYTASDGCGNTKSCCFNVVVTATPSTVNLTCPSTVTVTAVGTNTTAVANYTAPTGTSNCPTGTVNTVRTIGLASGSAFPVGTNQVCYTATDGCGSTQSCCFNVVVNSPVVTSLNITCPANVAVTGAAGATTAIATYAAPTTNTTCSVGTITSSRTTGLASGSAFPVGTTQVCYTASDGCGNMKSCCFNVIVTATPSTVNLTCPSTVTVTAVGTNTTAVANYTAPTGTSNCPTGTVNTVRTTGLASGSAFPVGTNQVCYTATDGCGSTQSCCFNVVVNSPVVTTLNITCPANVAVTGAAGATTAIATYAAPTTNTTCTVGTVTSSRTTGLASGSAFPVGTTQVCYTASDGCGNIKSCCFNVVVTATPSTVNLTCPSTVTVTAVGTNTTAVANYTAPTGTSNCPTGTVNTARTIGLASGSAFPVGTNQVCYTATDGCGSTQSCCFNVVVNSPVVTSLNITCPANVAVTGAAGATTAIATYAAPTTNTTCSVGTITSNRTTGLASGSAFPVGTTQVCYTASDGCGNIKSCCFNVVVTATPSTVNLTCPNNVTVTAIGTNSATATYAAPTGTSNCPTGTVSTVRTIGQASGTTFPLGTNQVCYTATDGCGSTKSCCFNVIVNNSIPTVVNITCPANVSVTAAAGATTATASYAAPSTNTTCTAGTITSNRTTGLASGSAFPVGTTQVCYTASDGCGNIKSCCFNVVVTATPSTVNLTCPSTVTVTAVGTNTTAIANYTAPTGTSNCTTGTVNTTRTIGLASGSAFPIGSNQVCYTATDGCGSTSSCCFNVVVNPAVPTSIDITCPSNVSITTAEGATTAMVTYATPTASSTCSTGSTSVVKSLGLSSGAAFPIGTSQVCYTAMDGCSNTKSCCFNVTVNPGSIAPNCDNIAVTTSGNTILINGLVAPITQVQVFNSSYVKIFSCAGNCSSPQQSIANLANGSYIIKVKFFNTSWGLICSKEFNVVVGGVAPTTLNITCPQNVTVTAAAGATSAIVNYSNPTTNTTCTTGNVVVNRTAGAASGSSFPVGAAQVCFTAIDGCSNTKSCCFSVVVNPPATTTLNLTCPSDITVTAAAGATSAIVNYSNPTTNTTCTAGSLTLNRSAGPASGASFPIGSTQICYTAADGCGNNKSCCFNVVVNPPATTTLNLTCPSDITVTAAAGATSAIVNYSNPTTNTTCTTGSVTLNRSAGPASGASFPIGSTQICYTASDGCGNNKSCCFNVVVNASSPSSGCDNITITASGNSIIVNGLVAPITQLQVFNASYIKVFSCTGNCNSPQQIISNLPSGTYLVKAKLLNASYATICSKDVNVVVSATSPTAVDITCPATVTVNAAAGTTSAVANYANPTTNTTCTTGSVTLNRTTGLASGAAFPVGTTQVCYTATDGCGNTKSCCFNVVVNASNSSSNCDNITATATGNAITVNGLVAPLTQIQVFNSAYVKVFSCAGNCSSPQQIISNLPNGTYLVKVKLLTAAWATICSKDINVAISSSPSSNVSINCPSNIVTTAAESSTTAYVTYGIVTSSSCGGQGSVTLVRTAGLASGTNFPIGTTQVCYTASDACGSSNSCCFNVTVNPPACAASNMVFWSIDGCNSTTNQPSASDYSEFTPTYQNNGGFTSVSATNVTRTSGTHTCTLPRQAATGIAMCVSGSNASTFTDNSASAIRFSVTLNSTGTGTLSGLNFWNIAPTQTANLSGEVSPNNYPQKFGVRVLKNGTPIYKNVDFTTAQAWNFSNLNFATLPEFTFTGTATFAFEVLAYNPVGTTANTASWAIDDIQITGCSTNANLQSSVESLVLQAQPMGESVALKWISASQQPTKHFVVERSEDGQNWYATQQFDAHNAANERLQFDEMDYNLAQGAHHYRVVQFFEDGSQRYSNEQKVRIAAPNAFALFPNPASDEVAMELSAFKGQDVNIQIVNALGVVVLTHTVENTQESSQTLSLNRLHDGHYTVVAISEGVLRSAKLVVSRNR